MTSQTVGFTVILRNSSGFVKCAMVCVFVITGPWGSATVWIYRLAPDSRSWAERCRCVHMHRQERLRRGVCLRQITGYTWRYVWEHIHPQTRPLENKARGEQAEKTWLLGLLPHTHREITLFPCFIIVYCSEVTCSGDCYFNVSMLSQVFLIKFLRKN